MKDFAFFVAFFLSLESAVFRAKHENHLALFCAFSSLTILAAIILIAAIRRKRKIAPMTETEP